jgi:hypothetical protein
MNQIEGAGSKDLAKAPPIDEEMRRVAQHHWYLIERILLVR